MSSALVWFRRDLRDFDHAALYHALKSHQQVFCVFVFDTNILDLLTDKADRRVEFIWESVRELKQAFNKKGGDLLVLHGNAKIEIPKLAVTLSVNAVYCNRDYEPSAIERDRQVAAALKSHSIDFYPYKDQVVFEQDELLTQASKPYTVFTPYKNSYLKKINDYYVRPYPVDAYVKNLAKVKQSACINLADIGFKQTNLGELRLPTGMQGGKQLLENFLNRINAYHETRNFPALKGPSYLSVHLRFGTVSIRHLARTAWNASGEGAATWLNELIWRDFYFQILHHRPDVANGNAFKAEYNALNYPNNPALFKAWCEGKTGYPIIDAGMRQLNQTGYMHNRLRMVTASFLVKDLLVDWRWGEQYFAEKLIDFDFSANNGGWQWAASTGCDAQPYFRIFNPIAQSERFDPKGQFIKKYVPELEDLNQKQVHAPYENMQTQSLAYPRPIVNHKEQRKLALALYSNKP